MTFLSVLNFMQTATNYKKPLNFILGCPFHSSLIPRLLCQPGNETSSTDSTVELVTSCFPRFLRKLGGGGSLQTLIMWSQNSPCDLSQCISWWPSCLSLSRRQPGALSRALRWIPGRVQCVGPLQVGLQLPSQHP